MQALFEDRFVGVARSGHALLRAKLTARRYAACGHVVASRRGAPEGPVDAALAKIDLARPIVAMVPSFPAALAVADASDLVALASATFFASARVTGLRSFALPVTTPPIVISQMWHPRVDADPVHRCNAGYAGSFTGCPGRSSMTTASPTPGPESIVACGSRTFLHSRRRMTPGEMRTFESSPH